MLWLPLRAEEVPLASTQPKSIPCRPILEGRRYADQAKAQVAFAYCKEQGRFPEEDDRLPDAEAKDWWEVWTIGAELGPAPETVSVVLPLPFVKGMGYGTREHAVWISEPAALKKISRLISQTDQSLGGLLLSVRIWLEPALVLDPDA